MDLLDNEEIKAKMGKLTPDMQGLFLRYLREMYDQESDMMITFIGESRRDLLQNTPKCAQDTPQEPGRRLSTAHGKSSNTSSRNSSIAPIDEVDNKLAVERYMARRQRESTQHRGSSALSSAPSRPESVSLPGTPESGNSANSLYEEETQEIIRDMTHATARIENERDRQRELVEQMKAKKRAQQLAQAQMAHSILERAGETELAIQKDKQRQEQKLRERLEQKRRDGASSVSREMTELNLAQSTDQVAVAEDVEAESEHKEKRKKKKKKKDKDKDLDEDANAEEGERKKKKKKKKDKKKENEEGEEGEERREKRKKKKKHKDKDKEKEDKDIEDLEEA